MKRGIVIMAAALIALSLSGCGFRNAERDRQRVFGIVRENEALLRECVASSNYEDAVKIEGIESVQRYRGAVDFECGGYGFGPSTAYYGSCYVPDNDYHKITFAEYITEDQTVVEGHRVSYRQRDGDNEWNAERIADGFWYYDAAF